MPRLLCASMAMACCGHASFHAGVAGQGIAQLRQMFIPTKLQRSTSLLEKLRRSDFRSGRLSARVGLAANSRAREAEWGKSSPSLAQVSRSLHLCFFEICVENLGRPAGTALHEFVTSAVDGYMAGYSRDQLTLQLAYGADGMEEFRLSSVGYRLTASEERYQTQWLDTIYCTLQILKVADNKASRSMISADEQIRSIIHHVLEGQASQSELSQVRFDRGLATKGASGGAIAEKSVVAPQWIPLTQLILLTVKVVDEFSK